MIPGTTFRRKLLLLALLPLALAQLVTIYAVMRTVERDVEARAADSLAISAGVVDEYLEGRSSQLRTSVTVLAADFGLKEAVATSDEPTIRSVLQNHRLRVGADLAAIFALDGSPIASTDATAGYDLRLFDDNEIDPQSTRALQSTELVGDAAYQVFAVPLRAPTPIAWVVLGFRVDETLVDRMAALTGLDVMLVADIDQTRLLAESASIGHAVAYERLLPPDNSEDPVYVVHGTNTNYLATTTPFIAGRSNNAHVDVVLLRSLTEAMAPYIEARRGLIAFGIALLGIVALAGVWLAGSIARPLNVLADAARSMMSGNYEVSVPIRSNDEIGELASSFNAMTAAISEREDRLSHQALHHRLTDLPNYNNLVGILERMIEEAEAEDQKIWLLSIRLSRIGAISSTLGQDASDQVVLAASRLLQRNLETAEALGHLGGEEFVVLLPGGEIDNALQRAERLRDILIAGVTLEHVNFQLQSTIGIAAYPEHGTEASYVLRKSCIARSEAETRGEQINIYRSGRERFHVRQLRIVNDLRAAIRRSQIRTWFQPKVRLSDGAPCGAEALVRWEHPDYGWLSPDEFIPAIEEAGTIVHLTRFVLDEAIKECRRWQDNGQVLQVSVNVSARDLSDDYLPHYVLQLLREHDLPPERLTLEVTENSVMQNFNRVITVLECLRDVGVRISMDDFGTGQSSLAQLRNIPLKELKVDKSFVMSLPDNSQNEAIVRATIKLAHSLGLEVVAEGVENEGALRLLAGAGSEEAQGYFLSKPVPPEEFDKWLSEYKPVAGLERRATARPFRKEA